jgi:hypothetical protein
MYIQDRIFLQLGLGFLSTRDLLELHHKDEGVASRDGATSATVTIRQVGRNIQLPLVTFHHQLLSGKRKIKQSRINYTKIQKQIKEMTDRKGPSLYHSLGPAGNNLVRRKRVGASIELLPIDQTTSVLADARRVGRGVKFAIASLENLVLETRRQSDNAWLESILRWEKPASHAGKAVKTT